MGKQENYYTKRTKGIMYESHLGYALEKNIHKFVTFSEIFQKGSRSAGVFLKYSCWLLTPPCWDKILPCKVLCKLFRKWIRKALKNKELGLFKMGYYPVTAVVCISGTPIPFSYIAWWRTEVVSSCGQVSPVTAAPQTSRHPQHWSHTHTNLHPLLAQKEKYRHSKFLC